MENNKRSLQEESIKNFIKKLSSKSSSPGGGAGAALVGAIGASLAAMTCNINASKIKSNPKHEQSNKRAKKIEVFCLELSELIDKDAQAFSSLSEVWKEGGEKLQTALHEAALVPHTICRLCIESLQAIEDEAMVTSDHLISDLVEAFLLLHAGFNAARLNVEINLDLIQDEDRCREARGELDHWQVMIKDMRVAFDSFLIKRKANDSN